MSSGPHAERVGYVRVSKMSGCFPDVRSLHLYFMKRNCLHDTLSS